VRMTPLDGALIAATVATGGTTMGPSLISKRLRPDGTVDTQVTASPLRTAVPGPVAENLRDMMRGAVESGVAKAAQRPGLDVGGLAATVETGDHTRHTWFIGFAMRDSRPVAAVAVLLENVDPTGTREAADVGGEVLRAVADLG
jgi:penicillin-binding protein A